MFALVICNSAFLRGLRARHFSWTKIPFFLLTSSRTTTYAILLDLVRMKYILPYIFTFLPRECLLYVYHTGAQYILARKTRCPIPGLSSLSKDSYSWTAFSSCWVY